MGFFAMILDHNVLLETITLYLGTLLKGKSWNIFSDYSLDLVGPAIALNLSSPSVPFVLTEHKDGLKGAQVWDFDLLDSNDFLSWSLYR